MRNNEIIFPPPGGTVDDWPARPVEPSVTIRFPSTKLGADDLERLREAFRLLQYLFPNCDIAVEPRNRREDLPAAEAPASRSNRDKVLAVTKDIPATVDDITKATGIDAKKIRGVLTAPDLVFERMRNGKLVAYKFVATRERKRNKSAKSTASANGEP